VAQTYQLPPKRLRFFIVILLAIGIFFRFVNLDKKVYWHDETYTSLRVSGYKVEQVSRKLFNSQEISIKDLQKYQRPNPETSAIDTIKGLAQEEPQHPPLYYAIARFWAQWFGSSPTAMRSLPVLFSLLVFPCIYCLCLELFDSSIVGWVAVVLIAVSPIFIRYAQEARQYSLWTVMILLSSVVLLRAIRLKTKFSWIAYAVTVALSLYCHLLSGLVFIGHGIYVFTSERFRPSKTFTAYLLASSFGILTFTPWLAVIVINNKRLFATTDWTKAPLPFLSLLKAWSLYLSRIFISWNYEYNDFSIYLALPILILVLYSIYFLCSQTPQRVWLFILTLMGVTALALLLPDLILGGRRSTVAPYPFPCYLGIQLTVAYLLATKITFKSTNTQRVKLWKIVTILLISGGVLSGAISSQAETWWGWSEFDVQIARIINQTTHPLVISDVPLGGVGVIPLSHRLNPTVRLLLIAEPNIPQIPENFTHVFLYNPSEKLRSELEQKQNMKTELVYQFRENSLVVSLFCVDMLKSDRCH
jgi:uncharacterized membrane protein